jgi:hypothetical protein
MARLKTLFFVVAMVQGLFVSAQVFLDKSLALGMSAKSMALGNTNLTSASQAADLWQNTALTSDLFSKNALSFTHNDAYTGRIKLDQLAYVRQLDSLGLKLSIGAYQLNINNGFNTQNLQNSGVSFDFDQITFLNSRDYGFQVGFAKELKKMPLLLGADLKMDMLSVARFSYANALGLNIGAIYQKSKRLSFGLKINNVLGRYYFSSQNSALLQNAFSKTENYLQLKSVYIQSPSFVASVQKQFKLSEIIELNVFGALNTKFGYSPNSLITAKKISAGLGLGAELAVKEKYFLRASLYDLSKNYVAKSSIGASTSIGLGVLVGKFMLDYAFANTNKTAILGKKNIITLSTQFETFRRNSDYTGPRY